MGTAPPPPTAIRLTLPSWSWKTRCCPSGENAGPAAFLRFSVPCTAVAIMLDSGRRYSMPFAVYTRLRPSGERSSIFPATPLNACSSGTTMAKRVSSTGGAGFSCQAANAARRPVASDAAATGPARRHSRFAGTAAITGDATARGAAITASISARRSPIACQRRRGGFSRHRRTRSTSRGDSGRAASQ